MKKFELLKNDTIVIEGKKLFRIKALKNFADVHINDLGGYVESEFNLSQEGDSWLYDTSMCYNYGKVYGNAKAYKNSVICDGGLLFDNAKIFNSEVFDYGIVFGSTEVCNTVVNKTLEIA